jgi:glycosyltransferase involved in cell wall biosynthesis
VNVLVDAKYVIPKGLELQLDNRLNIAMVTSGFLPSIGGAEFVVHNLAQALCSIGHNVTVLAKRLRGSNSIPLPYSYKVVRYGIATRIGYISKYDHIDLLIKLLDLREKNDIDIIHCHRVDYSGCYVRFANRFLDLPVVSTPHGEDIQKLPKYQYGMRLKKNWETRIIKNLESSTIITSISQSISGNLKELISSLFFDERVMSIPNGLWLNDFVMNVDPIYKTKI